MTRGSVERLIQGLQPRLYLATWLEEGRTVFVSLGPGRRGVGEQRVDTGFCSCLGVLNSLIENRLDTYRRITGS